MLLHHNLSEANIVNLKEKDMNRMK